VAARKSLECGVDSGRSLSYFLGGIQQSRGKSRSVSAKFRKKIVLFINSLQGKLSSHVFIFLTGLPLRNGIKWPIFK
jgi:hypothetical protein